MARLTPLFSAALIAPFLALSCLPGAALAQATPSSLSVTYQDWTVRCALPEGADRQVCEMVQELTQADTGRRVLSMILRQGEAGVGMTIVAPFGLDLAAGLSFAVDEAAPRVLPFATCLPEGCIVPSKLEEDALEALRGGEMLKITLQDTAAQELALSLSLSGFSAALERLGQECCGD